MTNNKNQQIKFRSARIDSEDIQTLAAMAACDSSSEYLRKLIRDDAERRGYDL